MFALILFWNLHFFCPDIWIYLQYLLLFICLLGVGRWYRKVEPVTAYIEDHHVHVLLPGSRVIKLDLVKKNNPTCQLFWRAQPSSNEVGLLLQRNPVCPTEVRLGLSLQSSPSFVSTLASVAEAIVAGELHSSIQIPPLVRAITK